MRPAVEFEKTGKTLVLAYRPQDDDDWVQRKFQRNEELVIKRTYYLTKADLLPVSGKNEEENQWGDTPLRFAIGRLRGAVLRH